MTHEYLTYRELADRLGIKLESARKTVLRKGWKRIQGNDGIARIVVPNASLPSPKDNAPDTSHEMLALETEIKHLKEMLEVTKQDRDRWHALAVRPWWRRLAG
ncbi:MAG: hypothetical protein WBH52_29990 [Pseudomonas aeruginosa]